MRAFNHGTKKKNGLKNGSKCNIFNWALNKTFKSHDKQRQTLLSSSLLHTFEAIWATQFNIVIKKERQIPPVSLICIFKRKKNIEIKRDMKCWLCHQHESLVQWTPPNQEWHISNNRHFGSVTFDDLVSYADTLMCKLNIWRYSRRS